MFTCNVTIPNAAEEAPWLGIIPTTPSMTKLMEMTMIKMKMMKCKRRTIRNHQSKSTMNPTENQQTKRQSSAKIRLGFFCFQCFQCFAKQLGSMGSKKTQTNSC